MKHNKRFAFTLAEMMVVMLILTILLAAFAPLMTRRAKVDLSNPWRWASNNSDIYYGVGATQTALIGQNSRATTDPNAKLLINSPNGTSSPHITFKESNNVRGHLVFNGSNINLGNTIPIANTGTNNIGIGNSSLISLADGYENIGIGTSSLSANTRGYSNTALGVNTLAQNTTGNYNVAIGGEASRYISGSDNTAVGYYTLTNYPSPSSGNANTITSDGSVAVGAFALSGSAKRESTNDIAIGRGAFITNTTPASPSTVFKSSNNIAIGSGALSPNSYTNLTNNIAIGYEACRNVSSNATNIICIGYKSSATAASNAIYIGNGNNNAIYIAGQNVTSIIGLSDKRLKNIKSENNDGLTKIKQLKTYNYTYKDGDKDEHVGVIAQDLQKVFPKAVTKDNKGYLRIRKEDMFYAAINAIKELDKMVQDLIAQVKTIAAQVKEHDTQIKALQKENKELKAKVQTLEKQNKSIENRLKAIEKKL